MGSLDTYPGLVVPTLFKARAHATANTSLGAGVFTTIALAGEDYDPNNNFAGSTYTAPITGYYAVSAQIEAVLNNNPQDFIAEVYVNGVAASQGNRYVIRGGTAGDAMDSTVSDILALNAGDTVTLRGYNNGANAINISSGVVQATYLAIHFLSPIPGAVAISNPNYSPPTTWVPAWTTTGTAPVLGNGSLSGRYQQFGKMVQCSIAFTAGSSTTFGTGDWHFSLPVTAVQTTLGVVFGTDAGSREWLGAARMISTTVLEILANDGGNSTSRWTNIYPFTWGNGDFFNANFVYEAA